MTTEKMIEFLLGSARGAASKGRLRAYLNSLALKPQRVARSNRWACELCACPIQTGDEMRGDKKPAHESCFQAVRAQIH